MSLAAPSRRSRNGHTRGVDAGGGAGSERTRPAGAAPVRGAALVECEDSIHGGHGASDFDGGTGLQGGKVIDERDPHRQLAKAAKIDIAIEGQRWKRRTDERTRQSSNPDCGGEQVSHSIRRSVKQETRR